MELSSCFSTESFEKAIKAGLPACRISDGLPIPMFPSGQWH